MTSLFDRVCLIIPPSGFLLDERVFMTLGILKIASVLEQEKIIVDVLDLSGIENYEDIIINYIRNYKTNWYGITATTPQMPAAIKIHSIIKHEQVNARIVLGGPHVTLVNAAFKYEVKHGKNNRGTKTFNKLTEIFDILVAGDGELAVTQTLYDNPPKIIDADDPKSKLFLSNKTFTELPLPARHLIDTDSYKYVIDDVRAFSIIAQLGCPFGCGFCGGRLSPSLRRIRTRTPQSIIQEMIHINKVYNICGFMFYDDELNVNTKFVELMNLIIETQKSLKVEFRLRGFIKAELLTENQASIMYKAGFRWILIGFESGHEQILTNINKKATKEDNTRAITIAKNNGLKVKALMSIGHPGESEETIKATHNWLLEMQPEDFDITLITTYPGSPYFDEAIETKPGIWTYTCKTGDRLHSYEIDYNSIAGYYKGIPEEYHAYIYTDHLSSNDLIQQRDWLESDIREKLNIPYNQKSQIHYEHSMGQTTFPSTIMRTSRGDNDGFSNS